MAIVEFPNTLNTLLPRGTFGFGRGYGGNQYGKARFGASVPVAGIYQRKRVGVGSTLPPYKRGNRFGISRMKFYRPTNNQLPGQQAWRGVFSAGKDEYDTLTLDERVVLSREARRRGMTGYNLFMSRWLQAHR